MMSLRGTFLYNILPKKRIFIAFLGFLISSTIITGGAILMDSIIDATSSYLGESEDVLVISNPQASTPYTSILPLEIAETVRTIPGVMDVSPEVMTAAVYKDKAVYFRGVDIGKFWEFTDVSYIDGVPLDSNDTYEISIGTKFASRNNLEVGDLFIVFSTRSNAAMEFKIKSIFVTNTLLDDEIIAPLWIGQFFAFQSFNYITHIRVKVDLSQVSKETVREIVTSEYELTVNIATPNSISSLNATVYIRSGKGNSIKEEIIRNSYSISFLLSFGEYEIQVDVEGLLSEPVNLILGSDRIAEVFVPYIQRDLNFRVITDEDEPIEGVKIEVYSQDKQEKVTGVKTYSAFSDENGEAFISVSNGSYFAEFNYEVYLKSIAFTTGEINNIDVELISRHPSIIVRNPKNESIVIGNDVNVSISATRGYSIYFYPDGNFGDLKKYYIAEEGEIPPPGILVPFDEGDHSITIIVFNKDYPGSGDKSKNYGETTVFFSISHSFPETISFSNAVNGTHISPSSTLFLNSSIYFSRYTTYKWNNDEWTLLTGYSIKSPSEIGVHKLTIKGVTGDESKEWVFFFIIEDNPQKVGLIGLPNHYHIRGGEEMQVWYKQTATIYQYRWDTQLDTSIPPDLTIPTNSLNEGNHTLYLSVYVLTQWYNRSYDLIIDNSAPNVTLSYLNQTILESGTNIFYVSNETLSWLQYSWDDLPYSFDFQSKIKASTEDGDHSLNISACDLAGNIVNYYYEFTTENFTGSTPIDFYLLYELDGIINQGFIDIEVFSNIPVFTIEYSIEGPVTVEGLLTQPKRIYLFPGDYNLTIKYSVTISVSRTRKWSFTVINGSNSSHLYSTTVNSSYSGDVSIYFPYFDYNETINGGTSLHLTDGSFYAISYQIGMIESIDEQWLIIDTTLPEIYIKSPQKGDEESIVLLDLDSDATEILFQLDNEDTVYTYDRLYYLEYTVDGMHRLTFTLTDSFYNQRMVTYTFTTGLTYVTVNLTLQELSGNIFTPLHDHSISIKSYYNNTVWKGITDAEGVISFDIYSGKYYVNFEYSSKQYEYELKTSGGLTREISLGWLNSTLNVHDLYADYPMDEISLVIREISGTRIIKLLTDNNGQCFTQIYTGNYICYYSIQSEIYSIPFQVHSSNQQIFFKIISPKDEVIIDFRYDNGSLVYNIPVNFNTILDGEIQTTTGLYSSVSLWISYGFVNITVTLRSGEILELRRSFEPGKETMTIILPTVTEEQWLKIPFKPVSGFDFFVSVSSEYMDYYLKGSLLFTYTLAYAEVILILLVVIVNMYSILQNVYKESRRETTIVRMIGGTNLNAIITIFSRLGFVSLLASLIGYGIGTAVIKLLASANQTVFFGHTFSPSGGGGLFLLNIALILLTALISSILIARKAKTTKKITYTRR
ncbi:MAG: ABC transporter permease [Candidatus Heimdallarchaeota archaeon]|nr:ABC transporter permease [Candidatus Heimdallarchaeota archaeon]MCK4769760.1 ABC transporter permease [Candidatus Heimdallarchaeota archaeon]